MLPVHIVDGVAVADVGAGGVEGSTKLIGVLLAGDVQLFIDTVKPEYGPPAFKPVIITLPAPLATIVTGPCGTPFLV